MKLKTSVLLLAASILGVSLTLSGCSSTIPAAKTFGGSVKVMTAQLDGFIKEIPKNQYVGKVSVGEAQKKTGMAMQCSATTTQQTDGVAVFVTPSTDTAALAASFEKSLKADGWDISFYDDKANKVKKLVAAKSGYEYWVEPFKDVKAKTVTGSTKGIQFYGFGPCLPKK